MEDIRSVLSQFHSKRQEKAVQKSGKGPHADPSVTEIPDVFFDIVLQNYKLNRNEILVLMFLYRQVWCRPNLYRSHGIGPMNSYAEMGLALGISHEELVSYLRALEKYGFIETVRSGQYFVRKFFTEELDLKYGQNYHDFF
jgi:hypothetical protein